MEKQGNSSFSNKYIRDIAFLSVAFFLANVVPLVGAVVIVLIPLPILYCYAAYGKVNALFITALSLLLSFAGMAALGASAGFPFILSLATAGMIIATCMERRYSFEKTVLIPVVMLFALAACLVSYQAYLANEMPWHFVHAYIEGQLNNTVKLYTEWQIAAEQVSLIKENIQAIASFLTMIFPSLFLVTSLFFVWINLLAGRAMLKKLALAGPDFGDLSTWKAPEKMVWYLIGAGAMILLSDTVLPVIGWNLLVVILTIYLLAGLAIVSFFLKKSPLPVALRYAIYFLIFAQQIVTLIVAAAGLFDLWLDFRKLNKTMEDTVV